jgi:hypothetical protein
VKTWHSGNGRAIAQAVSRRIPTAAGRVQAPVRLCGICGQSGTEAGFLRVLLFPLPIFIPPTAPQSPSSNIWGWYEYNRPVVAAVPRRLSLTPLIIIIIIIIITPWFQSAKRTIPTERPPLVGEVSAHLADRRGVAWSAQRIPTAVNFCFLDRSRYFLEIASQLYSRG